MSKLTHLNQQGDVNMVDVADKSITERTATAQGYVYMNQACITQLVEAHNQKGDAITTAKIAGIMAAKRCADIIPLCHPLMLSKIDVDINVQPEHQRVHIQSFCKLSGKTGVEMEALTAVNVAALTMFDMCKAVDPAMRISDIRVLTKTGGKTGEWTNPQGNNDGNN